MDFIDIHIDKCRNCATRVGFALPISTNSVQYLPKFLCLNLPWALSFWLRAPPRRLVWPDLEEFARIPPPSQPTASSSICVRHCRHMYSMYPRVLLHRIASHRIASSESQSAMHHHLKYRDVTSSAAWTPQQCQSLPNAIFPA